MRKYLVTRKFVHKIFSFRYKQESKFGMDRGIYEIKAESLKDWIMQRLQPTIFTDIT